MLSLCLTMTCTNKNENWVSKVNIYISSEMCLCGDSVSNYYKLIIHTFYFKQTIWEKALENLSRFYISHVAQVVSLHGHFFTLFFVCNCKSTSQRIYWLLSTSSWPTILVRIFLERYDYYFLWLLTWWMTFDMRCWEAIFLRDVFECGYKA